MNKRPPGLRIVAFVTSSVRIEMFALLPLKAGGNISAFREVVPCTCLVTFVTTLHCPLPFVVQGDGSEVVRSSKSSQYTQLVIVIGWLTPWQLFTSVTFT